METPPTTPVDALNSEFLVATMWRSGSQCLCREIVNWVRKKSGPAYKTIDSVDTLNSNIDDAEVLVVGFFASESEAGDFITLANKMEDLPFALVTDSAIASEVSTLCQQIAVRVVWRGMYEKEVYDSCYPCLTFLKTRNNHGDPSGISETSIVWLCVCLPRVFYQVVNDSCYPCLTFLKARKIMVILVVFLRQLISSSGRCCIVSFVLYFVI